jgi:RNA polymerase sigma factor FliA
MIMKLKTATATAMAPAPMRSMTMSAAAAPSFTGRAGTSHRQTAPVKPMGVSGTLYTRASKLNPGVKTGIKPEVNPGLSTSAPQGSQQKARLARRDRVVLEHLPLVKAIAVRVHENLPVHVDMDDLVHAGILGLFDAASKYNPEKQVAFSSYAKHRIKGAILDSLRQLDWASRDMRRRHKQVEAATRDLAGTLQRNPTEAEVAEKLGMDPERWRGMMLDLRNVGLISASTRSNEYDDLPAPDFPCKPETHPDSICAREQLRGVLGEAMKVLPERYQKVVSLYYTAEMTMKEIGGILGINESRVSQIHKSALEKMQVVLTANGIRSAQAF